MSAISRPWHIALHARPRDARQAVPIELDGIPLHPLMLAAANQQQPLACTFEQAEAALERLPRMFIEPDGSFVQKSATDEPRWQIDGVLYDAGDRLAYVELKGSATPQALDAVLNALGWPDQPLMMQLLHQAVFLDAEEFRRWAFDAPR